MLAPSQLIRTKLFDKGTPPQLVASISTNVIFDFTGYDIQSMMQLLSGGQSPRVVWQSQIRELDKDAFVALNGTTQTVLVSSLYTTTGKRRGISLETAFLKLPAERRDAHIAWCMEHLNDPQVVAPTPKVAPSAD